jgi:hypothetical protein
MMGVPPSRTVFDTSRASLLAAILAAALLAGCALTGPGAVETPPATAVSAPSSDLNHARELVQKLVERARSLQSMQTGAVMEYTGSGRHVKAREQITVQRPGNLRVEAMSPFGVALVVVANDTRLGIFEPSKNTIYRGKASAETLNRYVQIPLAPRSAANLLLGLAPTGEDVPQPSSSTQGPGAQLTVSYRTADGSLDDLVFSGDQLTLVRERNSRGQVDYEVRYTDFRDIGGVMLAHAMDANFPVAGTEVKFELQRPIVNGAISDSIFVLTGGAATKEVDLDHAS